MKRFGLLVFVLFCVLYIVKAQVTTSGISGKVMTDGEPVIGATIQAILVSSGSRYGTVTNEDGRFSLQGMRVGGPYQVEISYIGFKTVVYNDIYLRIGDVYALNVTLNESPETIGEVVVTGHAGVSATRTGAASSFSGGDIALLPTISRSVTDITRLTPQATVNSSGSISFAGANNRYNSFQIDGVMNNDVFGLSTNGTNGGQAGTEPVSLDALEQIQVNIAPFDVRQSGFTGGGVNAITKSGTNEFRGTAYFFGNNQNLIGKTPGNLMNGEKRDKLINQHDFQFGATMGGPIIKDKLFLFANYERTDKSIPTSNNLNDGSAISEANAKAILDHLKELTDGRYTANFDKKDVYTRSNKASAKIDWNINDRNKFTARYSFVGADKLSFPRSEYALRASDEAFVYTSNTHSVIAELNSTINNTLNNELRASYVRVRDSRDPQGDPFPYIQINNISGRNNAYLGTDYSSIANKLNQDIFTLTDNFSWLQGNHNFTFGTHNELYHFKNLFIQNLYGAYTFASLDDFLNNKVETYNYGQSKVGVTGTDRFAPSFSAMQIGLYAQDNWSISDRFSLAYGIRMDVPLLLDRPTENPVFNKWEVAKQYDVETNRKTKATPLWSPRVGFRWTATEDGATLIRGGAGVFTGRIPFVWLSNSFSNTGMEFEKYYYKGTFPEGFYFNTDPFGQYEMIKKGNTDKSTEVDVFTKNFKYAQNLRFNLALEQILPSDIRITLEGIYSKTLNDVVYRNINMGLTDQTVASAYGLSFDNRPLFKSKLNSDYTRVILLDNTSRGYTYNLSAKLEKTFDFGLDLMASYMFGQSKSLNSGASSVAWSNWQYNEIKGDPNHPELSYSDFNIPHRVVVAVTYGKEYARYFKSTVSLVYTGQSGAPYNVTYSGDLNGDGSTGNDLAFIPTDVNIDQMDFLKTDKISSDQQRADLKAFLGQTRYLKDHRGEYYDRNADNMKFEHHFDFRFLQDFKLKVGERTNTIQLSFDIMNVGNMFNKKWGLQHFLPNDSYSPIAYRGNGQFQYTSGANYNPFSISDFYSRWRAQVGLRYIF